MQKIIKQDFLTYRMIGSTAEVHNFRHIHRTDMTIFSFFQVQNNAFWACLVVEI